MPDSSPEVYERPARSVHGFALITASLLTFLFTGRDAAITMNSVKIGLTEVTTQPTTTDHNLQPVPNGSGLVIWLGLGLGLES